MGFFFVEGEIFDLGCVFSGEGDIDTVFLLEDDQEDWEEDESSVAVQEIFTSRNVSEPSPTVLPDDIDPCLQRLLSHVDELNDAAIKNIASEDLLSFDWSSDPDTFQGVRETFTGVAGPTFDMSCVQNPVDVFLLIWDVEIVDLIVRETNLYADHVISSSDLSRRSRLKSWTPTTREEMLVFFAFMMYQGICPLPLDKDYFKTSGRLAVPGLAEILTYNRFVLLKKFLNFTSSVNLPAKDRRLHKIQALLDHLDAKFRKLYYPGQNIAVDESLLHWSGRLSIAQKLTNKAAQIGIKSFELCESATGYLWSFIVYASADKTTGSDGQIEQYDLNEMDETGDVDDVGSRQPDCYKAEVVYKLSSSLFGKGHTLVIDNLYNSPLLARCLKVNKIDVLGTLRTSRAFVPESLQSVTKDKLRVGEIVYSLTKDLSIIVWRDSNLVSVISTYHNVDVGAKEKHGNWRFKPQAVLDYSLLMGGVDKKDQLLSAFPLERVRNQVWYRKLFRRLFNVSILNSFIIFRHNNEKISQRVFRTTLAEEMIARFKPQVGQNEVKVLQVKQNRPILSGNHYMVKGPSRHASCVWCRRNKTLSRTVYKCEQCSVSLCFGCFKDYHIVRD